MLKRVTEKQLIMQAIELAIRTRQAIDLAGFHITEYETIAQKFDLHFAWGELPNGDDGSYVKDKRKIVLNPLIQVTERVNFSFCHELMHARIEDDADLLSDFADAYRGSDDKVMERLCNEGAAEILMPSQDIRQIIAEQGFTSSLLPELCERYKASGIAAALQMVKCASHECCLVIAEIRKITPFSNPNQLPSIAIQDSEYDRLVITYSARSSSAKYSVSTNQVLSLDHALYFVLQKPNVTIKMDARLPIRKTWFMPCDMIYFRERVVAFFNFSQPRSSDQLRMF